MTPFKNYTQNRSWTGRIKKGGLYLAVAAMVAANVGCSNDNGSDWETVTVQEPTKGVITVVKENADGSFAIEDEQVVESKQDSRIVVQRLNGNIDTLTLEQAKGLVQASDTTGTHPNGQYQQHHGSGLGRVIWWGAMGYMMGRSFSSPVQNYVYRNEDRDRNSGSSMGRAGGYYAGSRVATELQRTSVSRTEMRPVRARSGFFGGSGRKSSGG